MTSASSSALREPDGLRGQLERVLAQEPDYGLAGFRQSGLGREGGRAAIESYTELKTVLLPFADEMM